METSPLATLLVRHLARIHGRPPESFQADVLPDGNVRVAAGPKSIEYAVLAWMSHFARDLCLGAFDAPATRAAAA